VAAVTLPRGVPSGFHGSWIADGKLDDNDVDTVVSGVER
jgi:hypothetical protein